MDCSSSGTSISLDSLEEDQKKAKENNDTILVPFYEKDVLMKVPKLSNKMKENTHKCNKKDGKLQESRSYLVNKDAQKNKSYLERFRKQFSSIHIKVPSTIENNEIRSLSPEVGDTSNESIGSVSNNQVNDFYNTESYNEIYYDKLLNGDLEKYLNESLEGPLHFNENAINTDDAFHNLKSVSEVSQPRRGIRRTIEPQMTNVRLGGLGPDMENIKPRLERARSLQRYSEKVRMENRVKIYKNDNNDIYVKKIKISSNKKIEEDSSQNSYLINKIIQENIYKNACDNKSKSADVMIKREKDNFKNKNNIDKQKGDNTKQNKNRVKTTSARKSEYSENIKNRDLRAKSSTKARQAVLDPESNAPPVHINFLVNVGQVRPSSALKHLEEKHRLYQEKIKSFTNTQNNKF